MRIPGWTQQRPPPPPPPPPNQNQNQNQQRFDQSAPPRPPRLPEKQTFYAVVRGRQPGIYSSFSQMKKETNRYKNALAKSFKSFIDARVYYEREGGDLSRLPDYVGYDDAVEKVLDQGRPVVEMETDDDDADEDDKEAPIVISDDDEELEEEDKEDSSSSDDSESIENSESETDHNLEYNLRGFSDDEEEDEISISMKELDERPSSVLSNGRSPAALIRNGSIIGAQQNSLSRLGRVDPNDPDTSESESESDYSEDGKDGQQALFKKFFGNNASEDVLMKPCALHSDIERFAAENVQNQAETSARDEIENIVRETIRKYSFNNAQIHRFGSGATGLALKDADLDLVILGVGPQSVKGGGGGFTRSEKQLLVGHLRTIARTLRNKGVCKRAEIISSAKVPIAKLDAYHQGSRTTIKLDLAIGVSNGLAAAEWIREQVEEFTALKPLVLVLKRLLQIHKLNNAATGGCGGYLLISLVVSHLKQCTPAMRVKKDGLGDLLLGFFRRFGVMFDYGSTAVAASRPAGTCSVESVDVAPNPFGPRPFIICEDPQERSRNITASAYRFPEVRELFKKCLQSMASKKGLDFMEILLSQSAKPHQMTQAQYIRGSKYSFKRPAAEIIRVRNENKKSPSPTNNNSNKRQKTTNSLSIAEINGQWEEQGGMFKTKVQNNHRQSRKKNSWVAEHTFLSNTSINQDSASRENNASAQKKKKKNKAKTTTVGIKHKRKNEKNEAVLLATEKTRQQNNKRNKRSPRTQAKTQTKKTQAKKQPKKLLKNPTVVASSSRKRKKK